MNASQKLAKIKAILADEQPEQARQAEQVVSDTGTGNKLYLRAPHVPHASGRGYEGIYAALDIVGEDTYFQGTVLLSKDDIVRLIDALRRLRTFPEA